jgi:hypothetical protein
VGRLRGGVSGALTHIKSKAARGSSAAGASSSSPSAAGTGTGTGTGTGAGAGTGTGPAGGPASAASPTAAAAPGASSGGTSGVATPPSGPSPFASPRFSAPLDPSLTANDAPCWVCFADTIVDEAVLLHCGHAGLCLECADNLWRRQLPCPMCRQKVVLVAQVGNVQARHVDGKLVVLPQLPREPPPLSPPGAGGVHPPPPPSSYDSTPRDDPNRPLGDDEA